MAGNKNWDKITEQQPDDGDDNDGDYDDDDIYMLCTYICIYIHIYMAGNKNWGKIIEQQPMCINMYVRII
jgi:hypothetical protein